MADQELINMLKVLNESVEADKDSNKDDSNDEIKEAPEQNKKDNKEEDSMKIKPAMGFERFLKLLFNEEDMKVGRIALRKILSGKEDTLTLRERGTVAKSAMRLYPILAEDRVTFQRMEKALNSK